MHEAPRAAHPEGGHVRVRQGVQVPREDQRRAREAAAIHHGARDPVLRLRQLVRGQGRHHHPVAAGAAVPRWEDQLQSDPARRHDRPGAVRRHAARDVHWAGEGLQGAADHDPGRSTRRTPAAATAAAASRAAPDPANFGKPAGPNADCARCGGTEAEKARCGLKRREEDILCREYNLCHAGLAGNIQCAERRGTKRLFCDDTETSLLPEFRCCKKCPSGYFSNDKPCFGDGTTLASAATSRRTDPALTQRASPSPRRRRRREVAATRRRYVRLPPR